MNQAQAIFSGAGGECLDGQDAFTVIAGHDAFSDRARAVAITKRS